MIRMKPRERFEEHVFFSTVRISIPDQSRRSASVGTGFLFEAPVDKDKKVVLLISNRHVYRNPSNPIVLNFHKRDPKDPEAILLGQTITLSGKQFKNVYYEHPSPDIDLACVNISKVSNPDTGSYYKTLSSELLSYSDEDLHPGCEVWFVGYPDDRFDVKNNLPILRRGYIASIPRIDFQGRPQLLIDAQVFPGSSGSPVFVPIGRKFRFLGVVTQTMIRNQKIEAVPAITAIGVQQVLGLGIVLKAHLIRELVDVVVNKVKQQLAVNTPEATQESEQATATDR